MHSFCMILDEQFKQLQQEHRKIENILDSIMKNPFISTNKYTISKEYDRLLRKSRSNSSSSNKNSSRSYKSIASGISDNNYNSAHKIKPEYSQKFPSDRYRLESKCAQIYGVQQLRYKPAYFQQLYTHQQKIHVKQQQLNTQHQQSYDVKQTSPSRKSAFITDKSLKSSNTIYPRTSVKKLSMTGIKDQIIEVPASIDHMNKQPSISYIPPSIVPKSTRRRSSILQSMLNLNADHENRNQFFQSAFDVDQYQQISENRPSFKKQNSKDSRLELEHNKMSYNKLAYGSRWSSNDVSNSNIQLSSSSSASEYYPAPRINSSKQTRNNIPDSILVRGRLYIKYQRPKR